MSQRTRMEAIIKLGAVEGLGPARTRKVFEQLVVTGGSLDFLTEYELPDLEEIGLDSTQAQAFLDVSAGALAKQLEEAEIGLVTMLDDNAPRKLAQGPVSPWFFAWGNPRMLEDESVGFSGSRDASPDALRITSEIATAAAGMGWTVISGGARGVDMSAHMATLEAGGATVVVLPQGILTWPFPTDLPGGDILVLSEFHPHDAWGTYRAMQRNKSIIHLTDRLIIPQAGIKGGTMNAAEYALKMKHPTWVVDLGPDFAGNRAIVKKGAQTLEWGGDAAVLESLILPEEPPELGQSRLF